MQLFGRNIQVLIESYNKEVKIFSSKDGFTIEFDIEFGTRATCTIKIWNVLSSTVEMCKPFKVGTKELKYAKVELSAGYKDDLSLLTSSSIFSVEQKFNGVDKVLEIKAGAKIDLLQNIYILQTFENLSISSIFKYIFSSNNISSYSVQLDSDTIIQSISLNGSLQKILVELCKKANAVWYEKNGKIFIESELGKQKRESKLVVLNSNSGLIGSPEIISNKLKAKSLLNPHLNYGEVFELQYKDLLNDKIIVEDCKVLNGKHYGGNKTSNFYTEFECVRI